MVDFGGILTKVGLALDSQIERAVSRSAKMDEDMADGPVEFADVSSEDTYSGADFSGAVVSGTDWTTETIANQLSRGNIVLDPVFQRRDAWSIAQKSRFIESLIMGLPVPQIVLAESAQRGKFIVLDGKQRLLSILQFWNLGDGKNNGYRLRELKIKSNLNAVNFTELESSPKFRDDFNSLSNQSVRTVVIKNWRSTDFLHEVFLRLNTGTLKLSPQELRQALMPGDFTNWVDTAASGSAGLAKLLKLPTNEGKPVPDPRMRDAELFARYIGMATRLESYEGRMKDFLDATFKSFNSSWTTDQAKLHALLNDFESGVEALIKIFKNEVARKPGSPQLNKTIFDLLIFYARSEAIRNAMLQVPEAVCSSYKALFKDRSFNEAVDKDTAGLPPTCYRLEKWGRALNEVLPVQFTIPRMVTNDDESRGIVFGGF